MSNKFIGRTDVNNSPFSVLEFEDGKHIIAVGKHRCSEKTFASTEEAIKYINKKPWDLITNITYIAIFIAEEQKKQQTNN